MFGLNAASKKRKNLLHLQVGAVVQEFPLSPNTELHSQGQELLVQLSSVPTPGPGLHSLHSKLYKALEHVRASAPALCDPVASVWFGEREEESSLSIHAQLHSEGMMMARSFSQE